MLEWWDSMTLLQQVLAAIGTTGAVILIIQVVLLLLGVLGSAGGASAYSPEFEASAGDSADFDTDFDGGGIGADLDADFDTAGGPAGFETDATHVGGTGPAPADDMPDNTAAESGPEHAPEPLISRADGAARSAGSGLRLFTLHGVVCFAAIFGWSGLVMLRAGWWTPLALVLAVVFGLLAMVLIAFLLRAMVRLQQDGTMDIRYALGEKGTVYLPIYPHRQQPGKVNVTLQGRYLELNAITDADHKIPTGATVTVVGIEDESTLLVLD